MQLISVTTIIRLYLCYIPPSYIAQMDVDYAGPPSRQYQQQQQQYQHNSAPQQYQNQQQQQQQSSSSIKPADYVYFDRSTAGFSDEAVPRAKTAQLKLEHFYKVAVDSAIERNTRWAVCCAYERKVESLMHSPRDVARINADN